MLTKKDKQVIAGFTALAVVGFGGSLFLLMSGGSDTSPESEVAEEVMEDQNLEESHVHGNEDWFPSKEASFEDNSSPELSEEDLQDYLKEARLLMMEIDFQGILDLLEPVVDRYNLTGEGQELANMYTDANLMVVQSTMTNPMERARVVTGVNDPLTMAYAFTHLPTDVFLYTVYDGNSASVAGKGNVELRGDRQFHPTMVNIEGEDYKEVNPVFYDNPVIKLFLEAIGEFHELEGIEEIPLRVQGVDVTSYVAVQHDNSLILLGYYVDNQMEYGDRFQSVDWHLSHRQRLEEAVQQDWGRDQEQGGEENDERETDDMEEE